MPATDDFPEVFEKLRAMLKKYNSPAGPIQR